MAYKWTMLLQIGTNIDDPGASLHRVGGWTESWYTTGAPTTSLQNSFKTLCQKRANMLGLGGSCVGFRIQQVDPRGSSQQQALSYASPGIFQTDTPGTALLVTIGSSGLANVRREKFAGIPDNQVAKGEFNPTPEYTPILNAFFAELAGWRFRARDLTVPRVNLDTIAADGTYATQSDFTAPQGSVVVVRRTQNSLKRNVSGTFVVGTATSLRAGKLNNWTAGACTLGTISLYVPIYPPITAGLVQPARITFRKVGRPFVGFRGRRSKKRS